MCVCERRERERETDNYKKKLPSVSGAVGAICLQYRVFLMILRRSFIAENLKISSIFSPDVPRKLVKQTHTCT